MKMITIKVFDNPIDAHILKSKLESEGIHCYVFDENIVSLNLLYSNAIGGVRLRVSEDDEQLANEIIASVEEQPFVNELDQEIKCPSCGSTNLISDFKSTQGLKSLFLLVFPLLYKAKFQCKDCGTVLKKVD
jgi:rubredoxin